MTDTSSPTVSTESIASDLSEAKQRRGKRGRKPKEESVRVDADEGSIDGDHYDFINVKRLINADPEMIYHWVSADDEVRYQQRRWRAVVWGPKCCYPRLHAGDVKDGERIRYKELCLFAESKADYDKRISSDRRRREHGERKKAVGENARRTGGTFFESINSYDLSTNKE